MSCARTVPTIFPTRNSSDRKHYQAIGSIEPSPTRRLCVAGSLCWRHSQNATGAFRNTCSVGGNGGACGETLRRMGYRGGSHRPHRPRSSPWPSRRRPTLRHPTRPRPSSSRVDGRHRVGSRLPAGPRASQIVFQPRHPMTSGAGLLRASQGRAIGAGDGQVAPTIGSRQRARCAGYPTAADRR